MLRYFRKNDTVTPLDEQINAVLTEMQSLGVASEDYKAQMEYLERLYKLKTDNRQMPVSRDTILLVAGNLLGILVVVAYEQKHVWTSKANQIVPRPNAPK